MTPEQESSEESEEDEGEEEEDSEDSRPIRITRSSLNAPAAKPHLSPRKNASRRTRATRKPDSSDEDFENSSDDQSSSASPSSEDDSDYGNSKPKVKVKPPKRKAPRVPPELGRVIPFSDFAADSYGADGALYTHIPTCAKCNGVPTHLSRAKPKKKSKLEEFEMDNDDIREQQGGWVACTRCCQAVHFGCLPKERRDKLVRDVRARELEALAGKSEDDDDDINMPPRRKTITIKEATAYVCNSCAVGGICLGCQDPIPPAAEISPTNGTPPPTNPTNDDDAMDIDPPKPAPRKVAPLLFRCSTCLRPAHYEHLISLQKDEDAKMTAVKLAEEYHEFGWNCKDCHSWTGKIDKILAWRPAAGAVLEEEDRAPTRIPDVKAPLAREYLVKWENKSFRLVQNSLFSQIAALTLLSIHTAAWSGYLINSCLPASGAGCQTFSNLGLLFGCWIPAMMKLSLDSRSSMVVHLPHLLAKTAVLPLRLPRRRPTLRRLTLMLKQEYLKCGSQSTVSFKFASSVLSPARKTG